MKKDIKKIVQLAISEDIGDGDLTSTLLENKMIEAEIVCRVGTYDNQGSVSSNYMNFFSFMATEDNTSVNLTNNLTNGFEFEQSN